MCFLRKNVIVCVYVDDCIIVSKNSQNIEDLVISLKTGPENSLLTDEGDIEHDIGVEIRPLKGDTFELCQPHLIKKVLDFLDLPDSIKGHSRPANKKRFSRDENGRSRNIISAIDLRLGCCHICKGRLALTFIWRYISAQGSQKKTADP